MNRWLAWRHAIALLAVGTLASGCGPRGPRPTPDPGFRLTGPTTRASVQEYAAGLQYDTTTPHGDAQYLMDAAGDSLVRSAYARYEPEIGAGRVSHADLVAGRVVARIIANGPYAPWGLSAGTSYVWVDSVSQWRMVLIPEAPGAQAYEIPITIARHGRPQGGPCTALARFKQRLHTPPDSARLFVTGSCSSCGCDGWCEARAPFAPVAVAIP